MDTMKPYSRQSFLIIMFIMGLLFMITVAAFYLGIDLVFSNMTITGKINDGVKNMVDKINHFASLQQNLRTFFVPVSAAVFFTTGFILWIILRLLLSKNLAGKTDVEKKGEVTEGGIVMSHEKKKNNDRRYFLHLLSVFQREGRLLDFFSENLDAYDDAQIGAAVRSVHESCNKTMKKYLKLLSVIDKNEGEEVIVESGFNPNAIKLIGNVVGEPPFTGVLRHRGWKASKSDLPVLSDSKDSTVISPAEVEIE
jgi:Domain of unknown function (DUF2760)